ncbi:MAG: M20/M25/M40 family metallo-hydrolase [Acidobacteriota bacterium]
MRDRGTGSPRTAVALAAALAVAAGGSPAGTVAPSPPRAGGIGVAQRSGGAGAGAAELAARVREFRRRNEGRIVRELAELVAIPNVSTDAEGLRANAGRILEMLSRRGIGARLLHDHGGPSVVYGEIGPPDAARAVVLYAHYDGQPADPGRWTSPPWTPVLRDGPLPGGRRVPLDRDGPIPGEWRLFGRSAADDKASIVALLWALDALRAAGEAVSVRLKFFFEGEEEAGSAGLRKLIERHLEILSSDAWIFCDGPVHPTRRPQVVFGVRGQLGMELAVYGAVRPLHSGHYGNWAPNPAALLADLLASMRDPDGRILIDGYYEDVRPITAAERRALAGIPQADAELRRALLLRETEAGDAPLAERIMLPALNVRGLSSGEVGELATNSIPTEARASIDFRLVPDQTPGRVRALVEGHIRKRGFHLVRGRPDPGTRAAHPLIARVEWEDGYAAMRTSMEHPAARALMRVVGEATGGRAIAVPTLGGSLPLQPLARVLGVPLIVLPIANHDDNQHAPDENLRLQNLWDGIEVFAVMMARLGEVWEEEASR